MKWTRLLFCGALCAALVIATNTGQAGQATAKNAVVLNVDHNGPNVALNATAEEGHLVAANANAPNGAIIQEASAAPNSIVAAAVATNINQEAAPNANAGNQETGQAVVTSVNAPNNNVTARVAVMNVVPHLLQ